MAITTTKDIGPGDRHLSGRDPDAQHPLEVALPSVQGVDAGIPGGMTAELRAAEAKRLEAPAPQVGATSEYLAYNPEPDPTVHEVDTDFSGGKEVPRHDRYADENNPHPTPDRVVPSTPTNANPSFADYPVPTADRPGYADGTDTETVALALGQDPETAPEPEVTYEVPEGPLAGEGGWVVRDPTEDATGASSPIGDEHNDPTGQRAADTKAEADAIAESHGGTVKDYGQDAPAPGGEVVAVEDGVTPSPAGEVEPAPEPDDALVRPALSATKAEWVDYVLANYELTHSEAEAMTKAELVETYGS